MKQRLDQNEEKFSPSRHASFTIRKSLTSRVSSFPFEVSLPHRLFVSLVNKKERDVGTQVSLGIPSQVSLFPILRVLIVTTCTVDAPQSAAKSGIRSSDTLPAPLPRWQIALMAVTIFVSAFLLFQVQPLISKKLLPWFGGSPAVWTTAMLFFQTTLFAGYAYAHLVTHKLQPRTHLLVHMVLVVVSALLACLINPSDSWKPNGDENPTLYVLMLLAVSIGIPYFTLASTGPIVQAWFARVRPGASPYRLYSLSNVGSYLALLSFPYMFEPYFSLPAMSVAWTAVYSVFAVACVGTSLAVLAIISRAESNVDQPTEASLLKGEKPTAWMRALWIFLPALASLTMIAATDHVSHHVAPEPRLWITTLGLYLLTFIITFDHERWYKRSLVGVACAVAILFLSGKSDLLDWVGLEWSFGAKELRWSHFVVMFLICFLCHGELVRLRPKNNAYLTDFYLCISAGGACGGLFATLVAVNLFHDYFEWPLCLVLALFVCVSVLVLPSGSTRLPRETQWSQMSNRRIYAMSTMSMASVAWILFFMDPWQWRSQVSDDYSSRVLHMGRNFYGVVSVEDQIHASDPYASYRGFYSGNVTHGMQFKSQQIRLRPLSYYTEESGMGQAVRYLQKRQPSIRIAVIGLGAGSIASYARESDTVDFYEINPEVIRIAQEYFSFLKECKGKTNLLLGDGRLKLDANEGTLYDMIILDAFTGGSVPVHLLTQEAFQIYQKRLAVNGFIVAHATNSYLNLYPVIKRQAEELEMSFRCHFVPFDKEKFIRKNFYMCLTNDPTYLMETVNLYPPIYDSEGNALPSTEPDQSNVSLWTDQFSSINQIARE